MRYKPDEPRYDEPEKVMLQAGRFDGGRALIVLGGYSARGWRDIKDEINPDVLIIANGVNSMIHGADYWICAENMTRAHREAAKGSEADKQLVEMYHRDAGARCRLVSHHSIDLLKDHSNCIAIRRQGYELEEMDRWFSLREYGLGLLAGWLLQHKEAGAPVHVGTVGAQCLHLAGILGCAEVHTIGYDLVFRNNEHHHAYEYPKYKTDRFRSSQYRLQYKGVDTQWAWVETAQWLKAIEWVFERDGLMWVDHSHGLLEIEGL
jgi:hypothetical protein